MVVWWYAGTERVNKTAFGQRSHSRRVSWLWAAIKKLAPQLALGSGQIVGASVDNLILFLAASEKRTTLELMAVWRYGGTEARIKMPVVTILQHILDRHQKHISHNATCSSLYCGWKAP